MSDESRSPGAAASPRRVLVVEDDPDQADLIREALEADACEVEQVRSAADALAKDLTAFQAILLDYNLPDAVGLSILPRILEVTRSPVIMVTGEDASEVAVASVQAGASDYIVKAGDYLRTLPLVVEKNIESTRIRLENERLQKELEKRVDELRLHTKRLEALSITDYLTGLYNHRYAHERLEAELNRARRQGVPLSVVMLDLDRFKGINDTYGHLAGDQVLREVGRILRDACRNYDVGARYGGEEFLIILPGTKLDDAVMIARRIRERIEACDFQAGGKTLRVTASFGVAELARDDTRAKDELVSHADRALYRAKSAGRNRVVAWDGREGITR